MTATLATARRYEKGEAAYLDPKLLAAFKPDCTFGQHDPFRATTDHYFLLVHRVADVGL